MQMENDLSSVAITVDDEPVAVLGNTFFRSQTGSDDEQVSEGCFVLRCYVINRCDGFVGNDQYMGRGLWVDIAKGRHAFILENDVRGHFTAYNLAENSIV